MSKPTPRQTLEALERQIDELRPIAGLLPIAQRTVAARGLAVVDLVLEHMEHQVARWEKADELELAFFNGVALALQGGDPTDALRDLAQRYNRPLN